MSWWTTAIYDTCSLITLDKLLQERRSLSRCFPKKLLALDVSLTADQMYADTATRMRELVEICPLPPPVDLKVLLTSADLSKSLSEVDKLLFATAVHTRRAVVTGDRRLALALRRQDLVVGNMALILKDLVQMTKLTSPVVEVLLQRLAEQRDFVLGTPTPTWNDLRDYEFPK
jgi:hypothetical protein